MKIYYTAPTTPRIDYQKRLLRAFARRAQVTAIRAQTAAHLAAVFAAEGWAVQKCVAAMSVTVSAGAAIRKLKPLRREFKESE